MSGLPTRSKPEDRSAPELTVPGLVRRARQELAAGLAVLGDPMTRPESARIHFARAWQLHARAHGARPESPAELARWLRADGVLPRLRARRREAVVTVATCILVSEAGDRDSATRAPTRQQLRAQAHVLGEALRTAEREFDGLTRHRQKTLRWARRAVIATFAAVLLIAYAALLWRASRPGKWRAAYFPEPGFGGEPISRRDREIAFNWGKRSPLPGIPADDFSVRWDTCLDLDAPTRAAFQLISNNDSRLFIDGELAVDNWNNKGHRSRGSWHELDAGSHHLRVEYRERNRHAQVYFRATFDDDPPRSIPSSMLHYPGGDPLQANPCAVSAP